MFILAQCFELIGFILVIIAMQFKNNKNLLLLKLLSTVFIFIGYVLIGSSAGSLVAFVSLVRGIFALIFASTLKQAFKHKAIFMLCLLTVVLNIVFWKGYLNIFSAVISLISIFCFFQTKSFYIRGISIIVSLLEIILNVVVFNPMNIVIEAFTIISCTLGILRYNITCFKTKKQRYGFFKGA